MGRISNVELSEFERFLESQGWTYEKSVGGHDKWKKKGALRPVILQSHIKVVPEMVIRTNLRTLGCKVEDLKLFLKK